MSSKLLVLTLAALLAPAGSIPDSWLPFKNQRVVSPNGQRYVVIKQTKKGRNITFEFCERSGKRHTAIGPVSPHAATSFELKKDPKAVDRDPDDELLAEGTVHQLPYEVLVPDTLPGFLLFEQYYSLGTAKAVIWVNDKGEETLGLTVAQLFDGIPEGATRTVSSLWWSKGVFLDEASNSIVVVAVGDQVREIDIAEAEVTEPDVARIAEWATRGTTAGRSLALDVLATRSPDALKAATPAAIALFHDEDEPLALRLRAAVVLARAGTPVAADRFFETARAADQPDELRRYAVRHLPGIVGEDALPVLRELMRGKAGPVWSDCQTGFAAFGEKAVPTLVEMLLEEGETNDYRGGAAHALRTIGSPKAYDALLQATATAPDYVANAACNAVIAIGGDDLTERLIAILAKGCTQNGRIAMFLQKNPTKAALPAIDAAIKRSGHAANPTDRRIATELRRLKAAREACADAN